MKEESTWAATPIAVALLFLFVPASALGECTPVALATENLRAGEEIGLLPEPGLSSSTVEAAGSISSPTAATRTAGISSVGEARWS